MKLPMRARMPLMFQVAIFMAWLRSASGRPAGDKPDRVAGRVLEKGHPLGFAGQAELAGRRRHG